MGLGAGSDYGVHTFGEPLLQAGAALQPGEGVRGNRYAGELERRGEERRGGRSKVVINRPFPETPFLFDRGSSFQRRGGFCLARAGVLHGLDS